MVSKIYQGIHIYISPTGVLSTRFYPSGQEDIYLENTKEKRIKGEGGLAPIVDSKWFDAPVDKNTIQDVSNEMYNKAWNTLPKKEGPKPPEIKLINVND